VSSIALLVLRIALVCAISGFFTAAMRLRPGAEREPRWMLFTWLALGVVIALVMLSTDSLYVPKPSV
jgi:choline-glycine betaine transporter